MNELSNVINVDGIECYEKDGTAYLKLETVARGLGFTKTETKNGVEYTTVRWERVFGFLDEIGFDHKWAKDCFIPENIFYRLAMKAKNEAAERFQAKIADEVIPSIRKHGAYMTPQTLEQALLSPDVLLRLAQRLKEEQEGRLAAERERDHLALEGTLQQPKVDYFDAMVERNLLLSLRETAKLLKVREKAFIRWLLENRYLFRGKSGKLLPYATRPHNDCFEVKEWFDRETGKGGVQTLVTPKGRETFRLLLDGKPESGLWHFPTFPTQLPPEMTEEEARQAEEFYLSGKFRSHHV